jgi:hypothetical protein
MKMSTYMHRPLETATPTVFMAWLQTSFKYRVLLSEAAFHSHAYHLRQMTMRVHRPANTIQGKPSSKADSTTSTRVDTTVNRYLPNAEMLIKHCLIHTLLKHARARAHTHTRTHTHTKRVKKKRTNFCYKDFIAHIQNFKHCPLQNSHLYLRYAVLIVSSIVGMLHGTHFL